MTAAHAGALVPWTGFASLRDMKFPDCLNAVTRDIRRSPERRSVALFCSPSHHKLRLKFTCYSYFHQPECVAVYKSCTPTLTHTHLEQNTQLLSSAVKFTVSETCKGEWGMGCSYEKAADVKFLEAWEVVALSWSYPDSVRFLFDLSF